MLKPEWIEDVRAFLQHAGALEQEMTAAADSVRAESEKGIDQNLITARSRILGILKYLHQEFAIPAGDRPLGEKERLILLVSFVQGARYVEAMIAEGQYLKSCAVLRQDYEFLTRTRELRFGTANADMRPNVRNAPEGSQRFYGQLSKVVHPQTPTLLMNFLNTWEDSSGDVVISHLPHWIAQLSNYLYLIHAWLAFEFAGEAILLFGELPAGNQEALARAAFELNRSAWGLEKAGLVFTDAE